MNLSNVIVPSKCLCLLTNIGRVKLRQRQRNTHAHKLSGRRIRRHVIFSVTERFVCPNNLVKKKLAAIKDESSISGSIVRSSLNVHSFVDIMCILQFKRFARFELRHLI